MRACWHSRSSLQGASLLRRHVAAFAGDVAAGTAIKFALALPVLLAFAGAAIDYSSAASTRSKMQSVADSAALASVRELQLARSDTGRVTAVANNVVNSQLPDATTRVVVDFQAMTVQVVVEKSYEPIIRTSSTTTMTLQASAKAKMSGSMPLCLLGLDPQAPQTIGLEQSALMTAPGCLVQSNSKSTMGIQSKDGATLKAGMICSAGGKVQSNGGNYSPTPVTDCPVLTDPLSARTPPSVGGCNHHNKVVDGGRELLYPGVYCGGLKVTDGAVVKLASGIYIIKDGPLIVDGGGSLFGAEVGFFLTGRGSNLTFDADSTISLSAPKVGPLAGILIFDDPLGTSARAKPPRSGRGAEGRANATSAARQHQILSDNARNLLGTIYMPRGEIIIDATKPIADRSAYTVLVVRQLHLYSGPNLILNTDYSATEVPVPMGVGPFSAKIFLSN
jgi:Flp pilus assembly protein TadG